MRSHPGPSPGKGSATRAIAALLASVPACQGGSGEDPPALLEVEGLAFLPSGQLSLLVQASPPAGGEVRTFAAREPLLVDVHEVTRDAWKRYLAATGIEPDPDLRRYLETWSEGTGDWPATYVTQPEARAFAAWRGMRLLEAGEWLLAAMGPSRWPYPWGTTSQESVANTLELGLDRLAPVGTFESGRAPLGCYDLLGNAAEWISDPIPSADLAPGDGRVAAMGGSFRTYYEKIRRPVYNEKTRGFLARLVDPLSRSDDLGLRCAAPASAYLWEHAAEWGDDEATLSRLRALGRRWGKRAAPLLDDLASRGGAPPGLRALAEGARS